MPSEDTRDETADAVIDAANQHPAAPQIGGDDGLPTVAPDVVEQEGGDEIDNTVPSYSYARLPVVALGGSAGSIQALKAFFAALPPATGMAYVVILHLSPEHESTLPGLLQSSCPLRVKAVEDGERLQPDHVYVIPPRKYLTAIGGHLRLSPLESERGKRVAVDVFFRTLADSHGAHAIAVVLSGADGDGAIGIKRVKERGGLTIAQDPDEAEHEGMPRSAIATGMVDWVLRVADMPARILSYNASESLLRLPPEDGPQPAKPASPPLDDEEVSLRETLVFLHTRTSHDFTYYKRATILRRIARRMQVNAVTTLPEYLAILRTQGGEVGALLQDLLISVTNFFRDRDAFALLETRIPALFTGKGPEDAVRVWCAACATGEEAYSMAMLLTEHARTLPHPPTVQVFGCDLDAQAIQTARAGIYPAAIAADVSEERLARFFVKEPRGYQVRRELRETVLFAEHDLLKDAPFSRLDLISCRNLLIYLEREAQTRAIEIFHFALKPDGMLFLGSAETVDEERGLFAPVDKKHRLYVRRPVAHVGLPVPTGTGTLLRALQAHDKNAPVVPGAAFTQRAAVPFAPPSLWPPSEERAALADLHFRLTERFAPPSVIVNGEGDVVHLSENAGRFLRSAGGQPTTNLLRTVLPGLRADLYAAMLRVAETGTPAEVFGLPVEMDGGSRRVDLRVAPAAELAPGYLLVSFGARDPDRDAAVAAAPLRPDAEELVRHLERELEQSRVRVRDTVERAGAMEEEYKSSNEELQSINEELRSASEELETSREELQSLNEELTTVNHQLKHNVEELGRSNSDLHNLMNATSIATVFLDRELKVLRFTPEAVTIFYLIPSDAGRALTDLKFHIDYPGLEADARQVLRTLVPLEREVGEGAGGSWFLARLSPYRSLEDRIEGVVLTFVDITERKRAEEIALAAERQFRSFVAASSDTVYKMSADWSEMRFLEGKQFLADLKHPSRTWLETYIPPTARPPVLAAIQEAIRDKRPFELEYRIVRADGTVGWTFSRAVPLMDARGEVREWMGAASDVTERKQAEEARRESEEKYRTLFGSMDQGYCILEMLYDAGGQPVDFRYLEVNPAFEKHNGLSNATGKTVRELSPDIEAKWVEIYDRVATSGESLRFEESSAALAGRAFDLYAFRVGAPAERKVAVLFTDITARKQEERQQAFLLKLSDALRSRSEAVEILGVVSGLVMDHFGGDRCYYCEIEDNEVIIRRDAARGELPSVAGVYALDKFPLFKAMMNDGVPLIVPDSNTTELMDAELSQLCVQMKIISFINVPVMKGGRYVGNLCITQSTPRKWADSEVRLAQEVAERTWAAVERARAEEALRQSEEKYRLLFDSIDEGFCIFELIYDADGKAVDYRFRQVNQAFERQTGLHDAPGRLGSEVAPDTERYWLDIYEAVARTGEPRRVENYNEATGRWYSAYASRIDGPGSHLVCTVFDDITERKRSEQAVQESEERLRTLADAVPQIIWANSGDGVANYFNRRWYEYSGLSFEQSHGPGWQAIVHPDDAPASTAEWNRVLAAGEIFDTEYRLRGADGEYRWFIGRNVPMRSAGNGVVGWFGTATDIHDLKQAEQAWRASEERHRIALQSAEMAAWDYDVAAGTVFWNEQHFRILGLEPLDDVLTVEFFLGFVHPEDQSFVAEHLRQAVEESGIYRAEFRVIRADNGAVRWMNGFGKAVAKEAGRNTRMSGVMFDVTERRQAGEALAAAQERLRLIVNSSHEHAILSLDLERRVESWNPGAEKIFGYSREEMLGRSADVIFTAEDRAAGVPAQEANSALAEGRAADERWHQRKDGSRLWVNGTTMPMRAQPGGAVIGLVKILRDETAAREAREALERSRQELLAALRETESARAAAETAGQAKDHFLAVLSHELRTPLMPITMALAALSKRQDLPEAITRTFAMIQRNVELEKGFIDDLLDVTRIERGKMEITRADINLHEAVERAVEVSMPDIQAKGQRLTVTLEDQACPYSGDFARLQQVFWNLLKNASKFTPRGGLIEVRSRCQVGDQFVVEIIDSGIGLEADAIARNFRPFEQANVDITREFGGLGLGLAIAKATVDAHGGTLRVSSPGLGQGATFTVSLPLTPSAGDARESTA